MKKIDPDQIIVDVRSKSVDLDSYAKFLKEYAGRKLDVETYRSSIKVVEKVVRSYEDKMSREDRIVRRVFDH